MRTEPGRDDAQLTELLRHVDHEVPRVSAEQIIARAASGPRPWLRVAAGILLALALGGVAYALPGSPLPRWVSAVLPGTSPGKAPAAPQRADPAAATAGLAFDARAPLVVAITRVQPGATLRVTIGAGDAIELVAPAGFARFTSEPGRVRVEPLAAGTLELRIPRGAVRVEVTAAAGRLLLAEAGRVTTDAPADGAGGYRLPLDPP